MKHSGYSIYEQTPTPKAIIDTLNAPHYQCTDNVYATRSANTAAAKFLACHLRGEHCAEVSGTAICNQLTAGDSPYLCMSSGISTGVAGPAAATACTHRVV